MAHNNLLSLIVKLFFFIVISDGLSTVFDWAHNFYIHRCLTSLRPPGLQTLICPGPFPQYNVTKSALALSQHRKESNQIVKFSISPVILTGNPMINFAVQLNVVSPSTVGLHLGFFIVIVKGQPTWRIIDMIHFQWNSGSVVDTQDNFARTDTLSLQIQTKTMFKNSTTGLAVHPFTSSFYMQPQIDSFFAPNHAQTLQFRLSASLNPTTNCVEVTLQAEAFVRMEKFTGFVIVFNVSEYNVGNLRGLRYGYSPYAFTSTPGFLLDLRVVQPLYGPSFDGKCLFGIDRLAYRGDDSFQYQLGFTPIYNTVLSLTQTTGSSTIYAGNVFCVGRYILCYEYLGTHVDEYTLQCSTPATCPLPVYPVYSSRNICPRCADYACHTCDVATRKICNGCYGHLFTVLNSTSKKCQCIVNFMPVSYPVTPNQGLWGSQNSSFWLCKVNCTAAIKNCIFGACTNHTYCTSCDFGYTLNDISPGFRSCTRCATILSSCVACSSLKVCDTCMSKTYLVDEFDSNGAHIVSQCRTCREAVQHCIDCTQSGICIECARPYELGATGQCDQCMSVYQNYSNVCMLFPGCMATRWINDERQNCIACISGIHYLYDIKTSTCVCERGYHESSDPQFWYVCLTRCGDGITVFLTEECDDSNTRNGDGCSQFCKVEPGYKCLLNYELSKCVFLINFQFFQFQYAFRITGQNKALFYFKVLPHDIRLETLDWKALISFNFPRSTFRHQDLNITYTYDTDQIEILIPYNEELEDLYAETKLTLLQTHVASIKQEFNLNYKINGINTPLNFKSNLIIKTQKIVVLFSAIFAFVTLLQFYLGSYFGKMIGLETLQIIQTIYFARMVITSSNSALLNSLNDLKYTAVGYSNPKLFFDDLKSAKHDVYISQRGEFQSIGMNKFFLLNIDLFLLTILIVALINLKYFHRKMKIRSEYIRTKVQQVKDKYTSFKRKAEWVYNHIFFPAILMFNYVLFFTTISSQQPQPAKELVPLATVQKFSFPFYSAVFYLTISVWSFEIFTSYNAFVKSQMTEQERNMTPPSLIEKLEHDENSPDRPNFHPFYILVYLIFYLVLQLVMVLSIFLDQFGYVLELMLVLSLIYFILIWKWNPYNATIDVHNKFLKLNHGTVVFFLLSFTIMKWAKTIPERIQVALMYMNIALMSLVVLGGFVRIYYEQRYRVLGLEDAAVADKKASEAKKKNQLLGITKKGQLLMNNKYLFQHQLEEIGKKYGVDYKLKPSEIGRERQSDRNERNKETLIKKIRDQMKYPYKKMSDSKDNLLSDRRRQETDQYVEVEQLSQIKARLRKQYKQTFVETKPPWA